MCTLKLSLSVLGGWLYADLQLPCSFPRLGECFGSCGMTLLWRWRYFLCASRAARGQGVLFCSSQYVWLGGGSPGVWTLNGCWQTGMWRIDCQLVVLGALLEVCRQMKCEIIELDEAFSLYWGQSEGLMTFTTRPVDNSIDMHAHIHTATHSLFTMYSWWGLV